MLIRYAAAHIQHLQKAMTQMNLQLHHVISDITGAYRYEDNPSDCRGGTESKETGSNARRGVHASLDTIEKALEGDYRPEQLFALRQCLAAFDHYQKQISECDEQIAVCKRRQAPVGNSNLFGVGAADRKSDEI